MSEAGRSMKLGALQVQQALRADLQGGSGSVRLSASILLDTYLLPPLPARLRETWPGITIELVASNTVKKLLRREADIAIRMVRLERRGLIAPKSAKSASAPTQAGGISSAAACLSSG
ncbi:MAG: LysR substrate-binding domain-containing protein [Curvibacter sp.]|jgi:DNA-binding transcriptional LysR family regulator|nr:hypothetical protein [Curvibacter sp.]